MAGLAREFNRMSDRLAERMAVLRRQRAELERSVQRIGEAFAHGLDREALRAAESAALQEGGEAEATREDAHALARGLTGSTTATAGSAR